MAYCTLSFSFYRDSLILLFDASLLESLQVVNCLFCY